MRPQLLALLVISLAIDKASAQVEPPSGSLLDHWRNESTQKTDKNLSADERQLFAMVAIGEVADFSKKKKVELRADRIAWLCTSVQAKKCVAPAGIWIKGAEIKGYLELQRVKIGFPVSLESCSVDGIGLGDAEISALYLVDTKTGWINASNAKITGSFMVAEGSTVKGTVDLTDASIGQTLNPAYSRPAAPSTQVLVCS